MENEKIEELGPKPEETGLKPEETGLKPEEMQQGDRDAAVEAFFAKKRAQVEGREEVSGAERMGDEGRAWWMGLLSGALEGESKGVMKVGTGVMGGAMGEAIKVGKAVQIPAQLAGYDGLHKYLTGLQQDWEKWRENEYGLGYEDWGTALGDVGAKAGEIAGSVGAMKMEGKAAAPIAGLSAFADTWQLARDRGHGWGRALTEAGASGMIHFLGFKAFESKSLSKLFKIPELQGTRAAKLVEEAAKGGEKGGFSELVRSVRNGSIAEVLLDRAKGALRAGSVIGVQEAAGKMVEQVADMDTRRLEDLSDEELADKLQQWKDYEERKPGALAPAEGRDAFEMLGESLKAGLQGFAEGAAMEGVMGAGELALTAAEAREQTAMAVKKLLADPRGRGWIGARNPEAMALVQQVALDGGKATPELLDAAGLPPDMAARDVRRLAHDLKRDVETAERRKEMETEEYRKRAELAERIVEARERGEEYEFETEEQKTEAERALQEREERLGEESADAGVAVAQRMADTMFGEGAGVLVRRGTAEEAGKAAKAALGEGADEKALKDAEGNTFGWWNRKKGEIVLFRGADWDTVSHELGWHATRQWAERNSPELLARMNDYANSAPEWLKEEIKKLYPDFRGDDMLDEIGAARFEREMGADFMERMMAEPEARTWWQNMKAMVKEAWTGMVNAIAGRGETEGIDFAEMEGMAPERAMEWFYGKLAEGRGLGGEFGFGGQAASQAAEAGGAAQGGAEIRQQIAGRKGAAALGIGKAADAERMEKDGASREDIWRKTGWWRGRDGQWRVEIPDVKMRPEKEIASARKLSENYLKLEELVDAPELFRAYPELREVNVDLDPKKNEKGALADFSPMGNVITLYGKGKIKLVHLGSGEREAYDQAKRRVESDKFLKEWIELKEELGEEHGTFEEEREKAKAELKRIEGEIEKTNERREKQIRKGLILGDLTHEIQHWIQEHEGFAKGGSSDEFKKVNVLELEQDRIAALRAKDYARAKELQELIDIHNQNRDDGWVVVGGKKYDSEYEAYRSLAGETEARNAERRLAMTPEKRAETPPWESEDVPEDRQIIRYSRKLKEAKAAEEERALKSALGNGIIRGVEQKRLMEVIRGLEAGRLKHPRFTKEEAAASKGTEHGKLWNYILSLESADVHAGGGRKGASGVGADAAQGGERLGPLGRMATRYGSDPKGIVEDSYKYLDEGAESRVYVAEGGKKVLKVRKLSAYDIDGVKDKLSKIIYHNYLFPKDAYTLRDIAVWNNKGHDEFYVILEQPLVTPKTDAEGRIIAPSEAQIMAALQKSPMRFEMWDEARGAEGDGTDGGTSSADFVPSARKIAYNGDFMVYDFKPGRNTFIDAQTGEVRFIDPRVELNDPGAGFSVSRFGRRNANGRVRAEGEDPYAEYTGYEDEDGLNRDAPEQSPAQIRPQRRSLDEERARTREALAAVRQGRVRVAATGGAPGSEGVGSVDAMPGPAGAGEESARELHRAETGEAEGAPLADGGRARAFSMSMMVSLYTALRKSPALPKVLQAAKRKGAGWVSRLTKGSDVELNPEAFGLIDETDRAAVKEEMKAEGLFRDEDPVWNMKHSKADCDSERALSEFRLEDRLATLARRRASGEVAGGNRAVANALAGDIGRLLMEMPMGEGLRKAAGKDGAQAIGDFRKIGEGVAKALEPKGEADTPEEFEMRRQAARAVAEWRGDVMGARELKRFADEKGLEAVAAYEEEAARRLEALEQNGEEVAGELYGMFLAAPEMLRTKAPKAYERIVESLAGNEALLKAYERIANGDAPTEVMGKIREQWSHEAQVDLARIERETDSPLGTLWRRAKRRLVLNLHSKEGPAVCIVEEALGERVAAAKRALKSARRHGTAAEVARAEANLEAVRKDARRRLVDFKMGVLKKQRGGGLERDYALNMLNRVFADIQRDGVDLGDMREYMKAKWCIALQGRADSYGLTPQEAQRALDAMRERLGEAGYAAIERAQARFAQERRRAILDNADVEAAFGPALVEFWKQNTDYVRSERILGAQQVKEYRKAREEWLKANPGQVDVLGDIELMIEMHRVRHGGSDGSVFAKPLEGSFKATKDPLAYTIANDMHILQFARRNALVRQLADMAKELQIEGTKEISDVGLGRALEGSKRYGSVAFMRNGERKLLILPKVVAEGFRSIGEGDVAGLVKANRAISAVLTQYSPRFAWRNMFRNRQAVENNIPWMRESRLRTATRYFGVGPLANLAEHLMERAVVRLPDAVARNWAANLIWGENTTMYWMGEATRIAKLMFDPKAIRSLAERADEAAANGDMAAAQAIMEEIAAARDMMKKPIFAGQWRMMMGQADSADIDSVFRALDLRTNLEGERYEGLRRAARAAKDLADTVRRFNTFEEARIKIVAELAAERARNNAAAEGKEFGYSQEEVDYLTATMAGSPRYEQRGRWMNVLEAIPLGPFANVGMKGAWRTVESMRTDPKAWWGKAAHRIAGRMAEVALWSAGGYALVAAIARRLFKDDEEAQRVIDGFESFGRRMARARACISDYRLRNYDIVPLGLYGEWCSFGINMPRGDEDRLIMPFTDLVARELATTDAARRAGLHDPIDGAYTLPEAAVATVANSGLAPDIYRGSMIWNLGRDVLYAWLQNPYNTFTGRNTYGKATWENRWNVAGGGTKDFFVETLKQAWNDVGGQVAVPATTWDEDAGDVPDEGKWVLGMADPKDAADMPVGGKTIFRALHYAPMASAALSGMFYMNCDGDARIARRLEKMQASEKAARDGVAMMCVRLMLQTGETAVDYAPVLDTAIKANGWDSMDRALIEQAIARKVKEAAKKMGRENTPILDVFRKVNIGNRERHEMERYLTGIGWTE